SRLLAGETGRPAAALPAMTLPTRFVPFDLERWQSTWENRVRFNLSESGVHPLTIQELLGLAGASALPLLEVRLGYSQSNGTDLLRGRIAALYPGVSPDQILVTSGSSEANFCACWRLIEPGDKVGSCSRTTCKPGGWRRTSAPKCSASRSAPSASGSRRPRRSARRSRRGRSSWW